MILNSNATQQTIFTFLVPLVLSATLLLPQIGQFGLWEPHETSGLTAARALNDPGVSPLAQDPKRFGLGLQERLVAASISVFGPSPLSARLPSFGLAALAVLALSFVVIKLAGAKLGLLAGVALVSSPVFIFHGRQLTGQMPLMVSEILAVGGLLLLAFAQGRRVWLTGAALALVGLVLGWASAGVLIGIALPATIVWLTLQIVGDFEPSSPSARRRTDSVTYVALGLALIGCAAFYSVVYFGRSGAELITGGVVTKAVDKSFAHPLSQLAYGWFPFSALVPIAVFGLFSKELSAQSRRLRAVVVAGIAASALFANLPTSPSAALPFFSALPMGLAIAVALDDLTCRFNARRYGAMVAIVLFAMMVRDMGETPETLLAGYAFENLTLPDRFNPAVAVALFSVPAVALFLGLGIFDMSKLGAIAIGRWPFWGYGFSTFLFGAYLSYHVVPDLAVDLSSQHALDAVRAFKTADEPLGIYSPGKELLIEGEGLKAMPDLLAWLERPDRVFALFPPKELAEIDRRHRAKHGRHVFVLDAKSKRLMVATSQPHSTEQNENPIVPYVDSKPFDPPPQNPMTVDFENKMTFLGWDFETADGDQVLKANEAYTLTTYWRAESDMAKNYKVFLHFDGPGGRFHGDHTLVETVYPTQKWAKGDHVKDIYTRKVPFYQKSGTYRVRFGVYLGSSRLKVLSGAEAHDNAIQLTSLELK